MKTTFSFIFTLFLTLNLIAQTNFKDGTYIYSNELHSLKNAGFFKIENGKITTLKYKDGTVSAIKNSPGYEKFQETSLINKNNALISWINTCDDCVWTETQTTNFFYLKNPFVFKASYRRSVNNNTGEDCFDNKCFENQFTGYVRLYPEFNLSKNDIRIGGKSSDGINVENIRITAKTTEITLSINTSNGNLNPPGNESAYSIVTNQGKEYNLLHQYGWGGDLDGGFGNWSNSSAKTRKVILFFQPIDISEIMAGFHLKEGSCSSGCWNFYDIKYNN